MCVEADARHHQEAPPFDLTGTWFIDLHEGFAKFLFGPPYPNFYEEGRRALIDSAKAQAEGRTYRDAIGQCYPPGMPMIMTRVWPHAFIQLPTAIYMISGFNNSVRTIFLDGRQHSDPDVVIRPVAASCLTLLLCADPAFLIAWASSSTASPSRRWAKRLTEQASPNCGISRFITRSRRVRYLRASSRK